MYTSALRRILHMLCQFMAFIYFESCLSYIFYYYRVGVVFCGRQSPGGHNVIWGLHNALKIHNPNSVLLGFLGELDN